jgi:hypothetical protein
MQLYWADPTTAFTAASINFINQSVIYLGAKSEMETPVQPWTPGVAIPGHVCLLAVVSAVVDPAPAIIDVVHDRHFGQQNIHVNGVVKAQRKSIPFRVANASRQAAVFQVTARPVSVETLRQLEEFYHAEGRQLNAEAITVWDVGFGPPRGARGQFPVKLQPGESRLCQLMVDVPGDLQVHEFFAVEIAQTSGEASKKDQPPPTATLGVVCFAEEV